MFGHNSGVSTFDLVQSLAAKLVDVEGQATAGDAGFKD